MSGFDVLEAELAGLLAALSPSARKTLSREITKELRTRQQKRIAAQQNADGSSYPPRKIHPGQKKRGGMFKKMRTAKYLRLQTSADVGIVEISGRAGRIAVAHQHGQRDAVKPGGPMVQYPVRELLGMNDDDVQMINDKILTALAR